jgi:transposase
MRGYELSDFEWGVIAPLLPNKPRGVPRVDDRRVLNGIFWVLRTGAPWRALPKEFGPHTTCYNRFVRWRKAGVWDRILAAVTTAYDGNVQMIDSTSVRVHQHAANSKKATRIAVWPLARRADDQGPRARRCQRSAARTGPDPRPGGRLPGRRASARAPAREHHRARRQGLRRRLAAPPDRSRRRRAQHPADDPSPLETLLQPGALPSAQSHRTVLQSHQTSDASPRDTKNTPPTSSPCSNSLPPNSGCAIMSL